MPKLNLPKAAAFSAPAAIWKRIVAFIVDLIILDLVIGTPFRGIITSLVPADLSLTQMIEQLNNDTTLTFTISALIILFGLIALLYFALLERLLGQTIGKRFLNITVVSDLKKLGIFACLTRSMYFILVFPFSFLWIIDPIVLIFRKDNKRLSEILSKTKVIETQYL